MEKGDRHSGVFFDKLRVNADNLNGQYSTIGIFRRICLINYFGSEFTVSAGILNGAPRASPWSPMTIPDYANGR